MNGSFLTFIIVSVLTLETIPVLNHSNGSCMSPVFRDIKFVHIRWLPAYAMLTLVAMRIGAVLKKMDANSDNVETLVTIDLPSDFQSCNDDILKVAEQVSILSAWLEFHAFVLICFAFLSSFLGQRFFPARTGLFAFLRVPTRP